MDGGTPSRHRAADTRLGRARRRVLAVSLLVPLIFVAAVYGVLLPRAMTSPLIAVAAVGLVGVIALVAAVGTERASMMLLVLAFGFAPLAGLALGSQFISVATLIFAAAFGLALPRLVHQPLRLPAMFLVGALLFTVMGLLAALMADSPVVSLAYLLTAVVALVVIPAAVVWMGPNDWQMFTMALAFGVGTAVSTMVGLPRNEFRNSGVTYHPVALAYTAMLTLSFVPFLLASKVRGRWVMVAPVVLVALVAVWTSGSRTSLVVLAALVVLVPMFERSIRLGLVVAAGVVLLLPTVLTYEASTGSTSALSRLFGTGGARGSDEVRMQTLRDGWEHIQQSPLLGNGYSVDTHTIHNLYLQVVEAEGLIGLVGLLLMLAAMLVPIRRASLPRRCLAYPVVAVILAGPFQPNMGDHYLGLCLGLSLVATVGVMRDRRPTTPSEDAPTGPGGGPAQARV